MKSTKWQKNIRKEQTWTWSHVPLSGSFFIMWQIKLLFKKLLKFLFNEAIYYKVDYLYRVLTKKHHPKKIINLGLPDPDLKRERAAIVYLTTPFEENWKFPRPNETNIKTIVGLFIQNGLYS